MVQLQIVCFISELNLQSLALMEVKEYLVFFRNQRFNLDKSMQQAINITKDYVSTHAWYKSLNGKDQHALTRWWIIYVLVLRNRKGVKVASTCFCWYKLKSNMSFPSMEEVAWLWWNCVWCWLHNHWIILRNYEARNMEILFQFGSSAYNLCFSDKCISLHQSWSSTLFV